MPDHFFATPTNTYLHQPALVQLCTTIEYDVHYIEQASEAYFFAHAHVWKRLVCESESGGWCSPWTTSHEPTRLVTTVSRHWSKSVQWTMPAVRHRSECIPAWMILAATAPAVGINFSHPSTLMTTSQKMLGRTLWYGNTTFVLYTINILWIHSANYSKTSQFLLP